MEQEIIGFVKDELRHVSEALLSAVANMKHFKDYPGICAGTGLDEALGELAGLARPTDNTG